MIAQKDGTGWVIANASRCGSSHLRTALTQPAQKRPKCPVADFLNPWQGGRKRDVEEYDLRIFLAREPLERWNSLYWYFRTVREKPPLEEYLDSFAHFMDGIVSREWSHYDCTPLTDHLRAFDPHRVLLLQDFDLIWEWIDAPDLWKEYYHERSSSHSNGDKLPVTDTLAESPPLSDEAFSLMDEERTLLKRYGAYDHQSPDTRE